MHGSSLVATSPSKSTHSQSLTKSLNSSSTFHSTTSSSSSDLISSLVSLHQFDSIKKWLLKHHKKYCEKDASTNKEFLQFLCQFVQFQEENLGKNAPHPVPSLTRLPFEVLNDFGQSGALCHFFAVVFKRKYEQKIPKLDLNLFGKTRQQLVDLCAEVEEYLIQNSRLIYPTIYFKSDLFNTDTLKELLSRLKELVLKHKAQIVDKVEEADHIVYPPSVDEIENRSRSDLIRVIRRRGQDILVHRMYAPDSHDFWVPNVECDSDAALGLNESGANASGGDIWEVTANWIVDTDVYNEWANQEDYEVDGELCLTEGKIKLKRSPATLKAIGDVI